MKKLIVANLKMNFKLEEALEYKNKLNTYQDNLIICPSYIYLRDMLSSNYILGSQDGYYEDKGAYTGKVSFSQLSSLGVKYSIIGHSERRHKLFETNEVIKLKYDSCIRNNIIPILCVGETKEDRDSSKVFNVIKEQIDSVMYNPSINDVIIAYEPVWAIGTNVTPTLEEIEEVHLYIKNILNNYNMQSKILYGGSVNINNIKEFSKSNYIDGFLIGSASLDPNNLINMLNEAM